MNSNLAARRLRAGLMPARTAEIVFARPTSAVTGALLTMIVVFSLMRPSAFATVPNARNIATDASVLLILGVGMTFVIITAGIDLSVGSVLVFASVVAARTMIAIGGDGWLTITGGIFAGAAAGLGWGIVNGIAIAHFKLSPLIVTLATLGMALGAAQLLTGGTDITDVPPKATNIGDGTIGQVPVLALVAAVITVVAAILLSQTFFGRYTYAIGSNDEAARRSGVPVERYLVGVYALSGALAGLSGWLSLARFSSTSISGHSVDNLYAITGVVLGGTSLFGGIGTIFGTVVGILIPAVLTNGFVIVGLQSYWQQIAVGAVLLLAVYADRIRRARMNAR